MFHKVIKNNDGVISPERSVSFIDFISTPAEPKKPAPIQESLDQDYVRITQDRVKAIGNAYFKPLSPILTTNIEDITSSDQQFEIFWQLVEQYHQILENKLNSMILKALNKATSGSDIIKTYKGSMISPHLFNSTKGVMDVKGKRKEVNLFNLNDYLGLAKNRKVMAAAQAAIVLYGTGGTGSRLIRGTTDLHVLLEEEITKFKGLGRKNISTITFPAGYMANLALMGIFRDGKGTMILDKKAHQSLLDGCSLSGVERKRFAHNDMVQLRNMIKGIREKCGLDHKICIVVDGVYSMDGDLCPLVEIRDIAKEYNALIILDDAHATGTVGESGRGTLEYYNIQDWEDQIIIMGTLGKSFGSIGGFVTARADFIEALKYTANQVIFSTSLAPPSLASSLMALKSIIENPNLVYKLREKTARLKAGITSLGLNIGNTKTHILPLITGTGRNELLQQEDAATILLSEYLLEKGFYAPPIISGKAVRVPRLRISTSALHSTEQIDDFIALLRDARDKGLISSVE
ncbi:aminotransferase class I/II-fold pyridoxal phosphate-dependent enzyme [Candidatus Margulisiibacteriota bacterium]